jgi:lipoprotein-anchoring transpeptidase ErfK/SrfK
MTTKMMRFARLGAVFIALFLAPALAQAREVVEMFHPYEAGSIVVSTSKRELYFVNGDGTAIRYKVAVGRRGKQWFGTREIDGKFIKPGAPNNPMGAAALTIAPGEYAVHGTSASMRNSIGSFASYGCIRMLDEDILDLYPRVRVGAQIHVLR